MSADTEARTDADDMGLKRCARCAAWIPSVATMCSYCGTTSPDRLDAEPVRNALGLPRTVTVTKVIIAANIVYFLFSLGVHLAAGSKANLLQVLLLGSGRDFMGALYASGAYTHDAVTTGHETWRIVGSMFLHGGLIHLGMNMMAMKNIGPLAEELFGGTRLVVIYLFGGAVAALGAGLWAAQMGTEMLLVGASGAIFAVLGALAAFLLRRGNAVGKRIGMDLAKNALFMIGLGYFLSFVSNSAHVAGCAAGILFGLTMQPAFSVRISPAAIRNWALSAAILAAFAVLSLGVAVHHAITALGAHR